MWLVFLIFLLFIGFIFSSIEISLNEIVVTEEKQDFKIIIYFKLFSILKIFFLKLDRYGIKIFNKNIPITREKLKSIDKGSFDLLRYLDIKLESVNFVLKVGVIDINLTNIAIVVVSTLFPILIRNRIKNKNLKYEILPEYDKLKFHFNGKISVSVKLLTFIKLHFKNIKSENTHNKRKIMV